MNTVSAAAGRGVPAPRRAGAGTPMPISSPTWVEWFLVFQFVCQVLLLFPELGAARVAIRSAAFGGSLLLLLFVRGVDHPHPAARPALIALMVVGASVLHPNTNTPAAAVAQVFLYVAIVAPLFWVPRLWLDLRLFRRVLLVLWGFHTLSSLVGILQVYFPGEYQPALSTVVSGRGEDYLNSLMITTSTGAQVYRPMGLTDVPGGAATAGFYAMLFGLGFFLAERRNLLRGLALASMLTGAAGLYLSQVRSMLVLTAICMIGFAAALFFRGRMGKFGTLAVLVGTVFFGGFIWAVQLGGESVTERLSTLAEEKASEVYYRNRGHFLETTVTDLLPKYPLGAGLGRWGMMNQYFGDQKPSKRGPIWVEIMWTGWLLDGGLPFVIAYLWALIVATRTAWQYAARRARDPRDESWIWGAALVGYNIGALALTFNYPVFIGQSGLEFWLLNAALFAATRRPPRLPDAAPAPSRPTPYASVRAGGR